MRRATTAVLALLTGLTLTACAGQADTSAQPEPTGVPVSSAPAAPTTPEPVVTPDDAQVVALTVSGGEVTGDTGRVEVPLGSTVRLSVTSDAADEVHVHGFELRQNVSPGQAAQLEFPADQAGVFEVELHDARTVLTRLQVS